MNYKIITPSKPKIIKEEMNTGVYEVDNLYPGYGHTLGNSLRRIIHSSVPGVAVTSVSIEGVPHEFSVIDGVLEDVINIILNLKRISFTMHTDEPQVVKVDVKGERTVTAADIICPSQVEVVNKDAHIATLSSKSAVLKMEITLEKGIGYASKESRARHEKTPIGTIILDADFTPIRRVKYEVEDMRVGDRTDYNRLKISIETDGTIAPRDVFEHSIATMISQLEVLRSFKEIQQPVQAQQSEMVAAPAKEEEEGDDTQNPNTKIKVDDLPLSSRTMNALLMAGIKTVAGLVRKSEDDILGLDGIGAKGVEEIKEALSKLGAQLKA